MLHKLGTERLANTAENVLITRREDGSFAIAIWNLSPPDRPGLAQSYDLGFTGLIPPSGVRGSRIDTDHSNTLAAYARMGTPLYPTEAQVRQLNMETALEPPRSMPLKKGHLLLTLPVNGFVLLEVGP